ncbi:MAG: hypothetical protein V7772_17470 [Pseudomonas profundi]
MSTLPDWTDPLPTATDSGWLLESLGAMPAQVTDTNNETTDRRRTAKQRP